MVHLILTSTYTDEIVTLGFDHETGTLNVVSSITVGYHPSWITFYPGDHSLVFTGLEQEDGRVLALKYDQQGKGSVVAAVSSEGGDPCSLIATKAQLYVANVRFKVTIISEDSK
jgi:6-phosphogluconolactonase (cycloisomerase 2 family)